MDSVRSFAQAILDKDVPISLLINNGVNLTFFVRIQLQIFDECAFYRFLQLVKAVLPTPRLQMVSNRYLQ